jgi:hypothetical protein
MGEKRNALRVLVEKVEGKRPLGRLSVGRRIILKWIFKEIEWSVEDWIHVPQDRVQWRALVNTVIDLRIPQNIQKFLSR